MCTVTYLPQKAGGFVLTSNRDEAPGRAGQELVQRASSYEQVLFPQDPTAGGTWIAASNQKRAVVLLNGAFQPHRREPPYRRSRGLMVLDYFDYPNSQAFTSNFLFRGMEPFTFILVEPHLLLEIRWDGQFLHRLPLNNQSPHLWASSTLYDRYAINNRMTWFHQWQTENALTAESIWQWHHQAGSGDPYNDVVMNRAELVKTVSITQIHLSPQLSALQFKDLATGKIQREHL